MKSSDTTILISLAVSAAAVGALVYYGSSRAHPGQGAAPGATPGATPQNVGLFPALTVGTPVLVDSAKAQLPPPFNAVPLVACVVDMILSDPTLVSVRTGVPGVSSFSGTIPRSAIVQILPAVPAVLQV